MSYRLFLFDADDTLFDFKAAERQAFNSSLVDLVDLPDLAPIYNTYRIESDRVWRLLEANMITKDELKIERFKRTFEKHHIDADPVATSNVYLEILSEADFLNPYALEIFRYLAEIGEVGIVTNGIASVQKRRLMKSSINPYVSFIAVSEECGFAKPDVRFFEYSLKLAKNFFGESTLVIGDRIETDIIGAHGAGLDSCLFNPTRLPNETGICPKHEINHLSELRHIVLQ